MMDYKTFKELPIGTALVSGNIFLDVKISKTCVVTIYDLAPLFDMVGAKTCFKKCCGEWYEEFGLAPKWVQNIFRVEYIQSRIGIG